MFKKLLTLLFIIIIGLAIVPMTNAQRTIDPSLKPTNSPGVPGTGSEEDCKKAGGTWNKESQLCAGFEDEPINAFIQILAGAVLMLSGGIAVIVISVGGIMYVTSMGNQQQLEFAKSTLTYGVIGMLVIIFSYFIVRWVLQIVIGL
ncbi:hypothetical protein C0416_00280 [bacterium]|nr:hypothetical protein [bacterium]